MYGAGLVTVDWGDGSAKNTKEFSESTAFFSYIYSGTGTRTIRIFGENITGLDCGGNQLTSLLKLGKNDF